MLSSEAQADVAAAEPVVFFPPTSLHSVYKFASAVADFAAAALDTAPAGQPDASAFVVVRVSAAKSVQAWWCIYVSA